MNANYRKEYDNYLKCINKKCKTSFNKYRDLVKTKLDSGKNILELSEDPEVKESLKKFTEERNRVCNNPFLKYQTALKTSFNISGVNHNNTVDTINVSRRNNKSKKNTKKKSNKNNKALKALKVLKDAK
uniref:Uncharacterized protein n=1 Tax=viral metagenome TaxID=1070528 RepID=A0A6C0ECT1_9ZZZZ